MDISPDRNPLGDHGTDIHQWIYRQKHFLELLHLKEDGETGKNNDLLMEITSRTGASIMGKNMFNEGETNWPEDAPFHGPVFVLTNEVRLPWERKGGTTFYFVNDGIESAYRQARLASGNKDIRISGGAQTIQEFLNAGKIEEFVIHLAPVLLGQGVRLFDHLDRTKIKFETEEAIHSSEVTHLRYKIKYV